MRDSKFLVSRSLITRRRLLALGAGLSGCAVASVASTAVDVGTSVVSTTADVAGDVVSGAADTVSGSGDEKKDDDKKSD